MANADGSVVIRVDADDKKAIKKLDDVAKKANDVRKGLDGKSILINTDVSQAEREIDRLRTSIGKLEEDIRVKERLALETQNAKAMARAKNKMAIDSGDAATAQKMAKEWDRLDAKAKRYAEQINEAQVRLDVEKEAAGNIAQAVLKAAEETGEASRNAEKMNAAVKKAAKSAEAFGKRIKSVVQGALVFTVITQGLSKLRDWMSDVVSTNSAASASIAKLKGALLTMVQPLVQVIIPAFTTLVKVLTAVVSVIANVVSALFGTTAAESANAAKSLNDQKNAYKGVGSAAKSASKQLASFDEINKLSGEGGGGSGIILPDFSTAANFAFLDKIADKLKKIGQDIVNLFKDVAGFIGNVFSGDWDAALDNIINFVNHARILLADLLDFVGYIFGAIIDTIIEKCGLAGTPVGDMLTGIKDIVQGALGLISGILTGDLEKMKQSVIQMLAGVKTFVFGIFDWFKLGLTSLLDWLDGKTNGRFHEIIELAKTYVSDVIDGVKQIFGGFIDFLTGVFTLDWEKAWEGIKEIFRGIWNTIVGVLEAAVNLIIKGINWLIDQLNKIHFDIPDWIPGIGGKSFGINISHVNELKIPRLAQGAVIPPNREFMAVLGDQKSGANIETPLATMVQAFKQALAESGYGGSNEAVLVLDKDVLGKVVYRLNKAEGTRIGVNLSEVQG